MEEISRIAEDNANDEKSENDLSSLDGDLLTEEKDTAYDALTETDEETAEEKAEPVPDATEISDTDSTGEKCEKEKFEKKEEPKQKKIYAIFDFVELFIFTFVAVLIVTSFFFRHSIVDGPSMEGTLKDGEVLIISNFMYTPEQFDIVVVEDYTTLLKKPIVKRVIATEGQTVKIDRNGVWVNGSFLQEPYVYTNGLKYTYSTTPSEALKENPTLKVSPGLYYEFVVPQGELFVMGDHRNDSTDSRDIGTVRVDAVLGKVVVRVLPFSEFGKVE